MLKVATCTVVRSYIQIFSAWWVATILYNYGATLCELRYYINARPPANLSPTRLKYYRVQRRGNREMHVLQNGILTATLLLVFFSRTENYWWCIFDAVCWFTYVLSGAHELRVLLISHVFHQDYFQTLTRLTEKTNNSSWCTGQPTQTIKSELKILSSTLQFAFSVIFFLLKRRTSVSFPPFS